MSDYYLQNGSPDYNLSSIPSGPVIVPSGGVGTFYNDRITFDGVFTNQSCEDFEASGDLGLNTFPAPLNSTTNVGGYMPGDIIPGVSFQDSPINDSDGIENANGLINLGASAGFGNASVVLVSNTFVDSTDIIITDPTVTAFGSDFVSYTGEVPLDISVYDTSEVLIDSFVAFPATNAEGSFLGFSSPVPIGRINISDPTGIAVEGIDNFCVSGPVPEGDFYTDRVNFDNDFLIQTCEDFEASGDLGLTPFPAPLNSTTNAGGYMPGDIIPGVSFQDSPINDSDGVGIAEGVANLGPSAGFGNTSIVFVSLTFLDSTDIIITDPAVTAFGTDIVSYQGEVPVDISVFDTSDALIDSFTAFPATNAEGSFLGFSANVPIGRINISDPTGVNVEGVDNFCMNVAPSDVIFEDGFE